MEEEQRTRRQRMDEQASLAISQWTDNAQVAKAAFTLWTRVPGRMFGTRVQATVEAMVRLVENDPVFANGLIEQAKQDGLI